MKQLFSLLLVVLLLSSVALTACSGAETNAAHDHPMAPLAQMPESVQQLAVPVQEAYQFAVANEEIADAIPCYCGCAGMGHTSSYDCYVAGVDETGTVQFDNHAEYCSICIDITQDTMRMLDEGKSVDEIFAQVEADYARFGPPTVKPEAGDA